MDWPNVAALFVDIQGPYPVLVGVDRCWDERRDARRYTGPYPVVCHPPCQRWGNYAALNFSRWGGEHNRPGNDGGCFNAAITHARRYGGVVEHPATSKAWDAYKLPRPDGLGWKAASPTDWVCEVWQSAYGHKAQKRTWLLYVSPGNHTPYDLLWDRPRGTHQIGFHDQRGKARNKPTLSKKEAIHTPRRFAESLVCLARRAAYGR